MNELPTTIYLNEAPPQSLGFGRFEPAKIVAAAEFTLTLAGQPSTENVRAALEVVFEQLNIDTPDQPWALKYRLDRRRSRSLSVGDVVVIGETESACAPVGWDALTANQLATALDH
jgi:hypothetical protein